jgi:hypothetical protein
MFLSIEALADAASTSRPLTSATEIISADAVAEVRRGLRSALRRPSVTAALRPSGHISARTTYLLISGLTITTARTASPAPSPISTAPGRSPAFTPIRVSTSAISSRNPPISTRTSSERSGSATSWRIAATGGSLPARRAAGNAAAIVTPTPIT